MNGSDVSYLCFSLSIQPAIQTDFLLARYFTFSSSFSNQFFSSSSLSKCYKRQVALELLRKTIMETEKEENDINLSQQSLAIIS